MLIHELSKKANVPIGTIRYYENLGLFSGNRNVEIKSNNYKRYPLETIERLYFIKDAKLLGFTLAEIKDIIEPWFNNTLTQVDKIQILETKMRKTNDQIKGLQNMYDQLLSCFTRIEVK